MPSKKSTNGVRSRNIYDPKAEKPFKLSRSKIELYLQCPHCFYLDRRLGIGRPSGPSFTLNVAVDALLKKEFDGHRAKGQAHPLMKTYGIDAIPYQHEELNTWRENFKGVQCHHKATNFIITGAVDDVWVDPQGCLIVVDYKATSKDGEIDMNDQYKQAYKRQMEIYQWLLRRNGFTVCDTGYFVYVNAGKDREAFDGRLEFSVQIIPHTGDDKWVEQAIIDAHKCLCGESMPDCSESCEWCAYQEAYVGVRH